MLDQLWRAAKLCKPDPINVPGFNAVQPKACGEIVIDGNTVKATIEWVPGCDPTKPGLPLVAEMDNLPLKVVYYSGSGTAIYSVEHRGTPEASGSYDRAVPWWKKLWAIGGRK